METVNLSRGVKLDLYRGKLILTKKFAEKNLSQSALSFAEFTKTHVVYRWMETSWVVLFEMPNLIPNQFDVDSIYRGLRNECSDYLQQNFHTSEDFYTQYSKNLVKNTF